MPARGAARFRAPLSRRSAPRFRVCVSAGPRFGRGGPRPPPVRPRRAARRIRAAPGRGSTGRRRSLPPVLRPQGSCTFRRSAQRYGPQASGLKSRRRVASLPPASWHRRRRGRKRGRPDVGAGPGNGPRPRALGQRAEGHARAPVQGQAGAFRPRGVRRVAVSAGRSVDTPGVQIRMCLRAPPWGGQRRAGPGGPGVVTSSTVPRR